MSTIVILVWLAGVVVAIYPMYSGLLSSLGSSLRVDTSDRVFATFIGIGCSLFWPLILVGLGAYLASHRIWVGHWIPKWLSATFKHTPQDAVR